MASQSRFASTFTLPIDPIAVDADMPATAPANMTASMADLGLGGPSLEDTLPELTNSMRRVSLPPLTISPDPEDEPVSEAIPRRLSRINRRRQSYIDLAEKAADLLQFQQPSRSSLSDGRALSLSLLPTDADWDSSDEEDPLPVRHDRPLVNYRSNSKRAPIERFRNAVKTVLGNLKLIKSLPENKFDGIADNWVEVLRRAVKHVIILNKAGMKVKKVLQNGRERVTRDSEGLAEDNKANTMVFNLNAFMAQFQLEVSPEAKKIMVRMPSERSERDLKKLHKLVSGLKCFEKYSKTVRHELCRVIRYERHETGRMVIRQGDPGRSFYFILSGSVRVNVKETDPLTGRSFTKQVDELHKGDSFGELALLKNITRQATILCKEATEFLSMDKEDFQGILRQSHSQELEEKINFLRSTELMASWPDDLVRTVSDTSQVKDFKAKMVLLRTQQPSDWIFLVRRGRCEAIKAIETRMSHKSLPPMRHSDHVSTGKGKDAAGATATAGDDSSADELSPSKIVPQHGQTIRCPRKKTIKVFLRVKTFAPGDFFADNTVVNYGKDVSFVSSERIECVLISKVAFYRRAMQKSLEIIKRHALEVPSDEEVLRSYQQQRDWALYKRQVISSVLARAAQHQFR